MKPYLLLSLFLALFACGKKKPAEHNDTLYAPVDYNLIIYNDAVEGTPVKKINIGNINIVSGKLIATDPLVNPSAYPLNVEIPKGKFPVVLYQAISNEYGNRIALAELKLTNNKAEKWVLTVEDTTDTSVLEPGEYFGFGVDSGTAGLYDYEAGKKLDRFGSDFIKKYPGKNLYDDFLAAEFKKSAVDKNNPEEPGEWLNYTFPGTEYNITAFSSGYGDGVYPVYKGIDAKGNLCCIVIDFQVLLTPEEE